MPTTERQRRFMYAELARRKKGQKGRTNMTVKEIKDYLATDEVVKHRKKAK